MRLAIDDGATLNELADAYRCLFGAAMDALEGMGEVVDNCHDLQLRRPWCSMLYSMRQSKAVFDRLYEVAAAAERAQRDTQLTASAADAKTTPGATQ